MKTSRSLSSIGATSASTRSSTARLGEAVHTTLGRVAGALTWIVLGASTTQAQVGTNYCGPGVPNTSGAWGRISASGASNLTLNNNQLNLRANDLPVSQFGFFLTSRTQALVMSPSGSQGNLCLGGTLGRYVGAGQVLDAGAGGSFNLLIDLSMTPEGGGFVQVAPGETWSFQAWFRDTGPGGQAWSNFTDGLEVLFTAGGGTPVPGMVAIPAGTFMMGSNAPSGPPYVESTRQQPIHQVTISYPFWMGQHEVTQAEFQALMGSNPAFFVGPTHPVEQVGWQVAQAYCAALTAQQTGNLPAGYEYRLPTEAEWEYACRAGTTTEFHYGPDLFCNQARFGSSFHPGPNLVSCGNSQGHVPVGSFVPNAFGLYDMHGNVYEWCLDSYTSYAAGAAVDPFFSGSPGRVFRGGAWYNRSYGCRSAVRYESVPGFSFYSVGFRVVLAPVLVP